MCVERRNQQVSAGSHLTGGPNMWDEGRSREGSEQEARLSQSTVSHGVLSAPAPSSEVQREPRRSPDVFPKPSGQKAA